MYSVGLANSKNLDIGLVSLALDLSPLRIGFSPKKFQSLLMSFFVFFVFCFLFFFFFFFFFEGFLKIRMQRDVVKMILGDEKQQVHLSSQINRKWSLHVYPLFSLVFLLSFLLPPLSGVKMGN